MVDDLTRREKEKYFFMFQTLLIIPKNGNYHTENFVNVYKIFLKFASYGTWYVMQLPQYF